MSNYYYAVNLKSVSQGLLSVRFNSKSFVVTTGYVSSAVTLSFETGLFFISSKIGGNLISLGLIFNGVLINEPYIVYPVNFLCEVPIKLL